MRPPDFVSVLTGAGDGTFDPREDFAAAYDCEAAAVGDFNLDGRPDIAVMYSSGRGTMSIFLNTTAPPDLMPPVVTIAASPTVLWPPNGRTVDVLVSGTVADAESGVDPASLRLAVVDEYGVVQPAVGVSADADGRWSAVVPLSASRRGDDRDGRLYTIVFSAADRAGNLGSARTTIVVPHQRRAR